MSYSRRASSVNSGQISDRFKRQTGASQISRNGRGDYLDQVNRKTELKLAKKIVADMRKPQNSNNAQYLLRCLRALRILAYNDSNTESLLQYDVANILLKCIRKFPSDADMVSMIFGVVKNLSGNLTCLFRIGFLSDLLEAFRNFATDTSVLEQACHAATNVSFCAPAAQYLVKMRIGLSLIRTLEDHMNNKSVCIAACKTVWFFTQYKHIKDMWQQGLGPKVLTIMRIHRDVEKIQEYCCGTIYSLGHYYTMIRLNAVEELLKTMETHKRNERIAELSCGAIRYFAMLESNSRILMNTKMTRIVIDTMLRHLKRPKVQEYCNLVFWSFGINENGQTQLMKAGAGSAVVETIRVNIKESKVVSTGCGALTNLSTQEDFAVELFELSAEQIVMDGLSTHEKNEDVLVKGLCALRNLLHYNLDKVEEAQKVRAEAIALKAKARFKTNTKLITYADNIVGRLNGEGPQPSFLNL